MSPYTTGIYLSLLCSNVAMCSYLVMSRNETPLDNLIGLLLLAWTLKNLYTWIENDKRKVFEIE